MSFKIYADIDHAVYKATADISKYSEETGQKIRAAVQTGCENIRDRAIRAAPKGESGKLVGGITAKMAPRGAYGEIITANGARILRLLHFNFCNSFTAIIKDDTEVLKEKFSMS